MPARAEDGHSAKLHSMSSGDIYIYPGKAITFEIKFENTGTATWQNYGENYTELVTNDPVLRDSDFKHKFWPKDYLLAKLLEKEVNPGEIGTFRFALQAPEKEGFYLEKLLIVARRRAWIENGEVELPIYVYKENPFKKKMKIIIIKILEIILKMRMNKMKILLSPKRIKDMRQIY